MKGIKKGLAILLVLCTLLSMVVMTGAGTADTAQDAPTAQSTNDNFYKIVHLDCGRKYFTKDWIIALINEMAADGYNQLQLAFGNDGLRFLLDDMSFTVNGMPYNHNTVVSRVENGNQNQNNSNDSRWLTQTEMDEIINAAQAKGIEIVPLLNLPGHANAILDIFEDQYNVSGSQNTFDVTNQEGLNAAMEVFKKYVDYFAGKGCKFFNFGADEYANDATDGSFSFSRLSSTDYQQFVTFINGLASYIEGKRMTPRAFNDGLYYGQYNSVDIDTKIQCCYWSAGWNGYNVASAKTIADKRHAMINTHGNYYYVLGKDDAFDNDYHYASGWNNTEFMGGTVNNPVGSMFCIWCDFPEAETEIQVAQKTRLVLRAMAAEMSGGDANSIDSSTVVSGGFNADGTINKTSGGDTAATQNKTITVTVGDTATATIEGADYSNNIDQTELDENTATVSATHTQVSGGKTTQEVTAIMSGKQYLILNTRKSALLTSTTRETGLALSGALSADSTELWTITKSGSGYTIKNASNQYLTIGNGSASVRNNAATLSLKHASGTWTIAQTNNDGQYYLNDYRNRSEGYAAGWDGSGASTDAGSQWKIYEIVETAPVSATTVTFTGVAVGETYVTVGNVRYMIKVVAEDLKNVDPLTVEYWITNGRPTASADNNSTTVAAGNAYSEDGVAVTSFVPANTTKETRTLQYWRCRLLNTTLSNSSTSGTEKQTETAGDDETYNGVAFTKVRYWNGTWAVYTENSEWVSITSDHQLVAYYLEILPVADELVVTAADWGKKGDGSTSGDYLEPSSSCTVSIQVVYEDGTTNPASTTAADLKSRTIAYGYWSTGRGVGTLNLTGLEGYQIWKVEAETGSETYASSSSTWGSFTVNSFTWDNNAMTVYEGDPVDSYVIHNDSHSPSKEGYYANLMWDENYEAILIKVYVKAKPTDDSLKVVYYDEKFDDELYSYNINVTNGVTFVDITPPPGTFTENNARIDVTGCGIENTLGVTQKFQTDLTKVPEAVGKYKSDLYTYTGSVISDDGKTLYLYYTINTEALSPMFVVDFGLPFQFDLSQVVNSVDTVQSVSVTEGTRYGTLSYDGATRQFTYTPTKALRGIDVLTINITFDGATAATTTNVGVMPATTVYYEEGFAAPYPADTGYVTTKGTAQNLTQTTEVAGNKTNVYGYDAAYASAVGDSNGTVMKLAAGAGAATFTFTGTGVDIYTESTPETGSLMIRVVDSNDALVKVLSVNTVMKDGSTGATTGQAVTAAYHVPVVSLSGLAHGTYTLQMAAVKSGSAGAKDVYLDGFRVYGTLEDQANEVYKADLEDSPTFIELRDRVLASLNATKDSSKQYADQIAGNTLSQVYATAGTTAGVVITSKPGTYTDSNLTDLLDNGPKNEIYLQPNQALTFKITTHREVQIGLKALNEGTSYSINNRDSVALNASTDMFYTVLNKAENETEQTITITNNGTGILSITKLKVCDDPNATLGELTAEDLIPALVSLGYEAEPVEAEAVLNITVQAGDQTVTAQLTATGIEGESHTFTAAEIKAAAEAALPEGYTLDGVTFEDVTVVCGAQGETSYTAAAVQNPTPDQPTKVLQKLLAVIKNIFERLFRWL